MNKLVKEQINEDSLEWMTEYGSSKKTFSVVVLDTYTHEIFQIPPSIYCFNGSLHIPTRRKNHELPLLPTRPQVGFRPSQLLPYLPIRPPRYHPAHRHPFLKQSPRLEGHIHHNVGRPLPFHSAHLLRFGRNHPSNLRWRYFRRIWADCGARYTVDGVEDRLASGKGESIFDFGGRW